MPQIKQPDALKQGAITVVVGLVLTALCIAGRVYYQDQVQTAKKGPTEVSLEQLAKIKSPSELPSPWIKVTFEKSFDPDVRIEEARLGDNTVHSRYVVFQAGERWMIAVVKPDFKGNALSGEVYHNGSPLNVEAFAAIFHDHKDVHHGRLFPFEFHADIDYGQNWKMFAVLAVSFAGVGVLIAVIGLFLCAQAFREPAAEEVERSEELDRELVGV